MIDCTAALHAVYASAGLCRLEANIKHFRSTGIVDRDCLIALTLHLASIPGPHRHRIYDLQEDLFPTVVDPVAMRAWD